jgi:beta-lactamase regulating signal transducer with metallopeptidase domain
MVVVGRGVERASSDLTQMALTCGRFLLPDFSAASMLVLALAVLGMAVLLRGTTYVIREVHRQRRFQGMLSWQSASMHGATIRMVADPDPQAFCAGYIRPRIYVSSGALKRLSRVELRAVLGHERHHQIRRDPLRLLVVGALARSLFFLPALRRSAARYADLAEVAADEAAVRGPADRQALASALLVFVGSGSPAPAIGVAPERVDHLLGSRPRWELPVSVLVGSLVALAAVVVAALGAASEAVGSTPSLPVLARELCMLVMFLGPVLCALVALGHIGGRLRRVRA